MNIYIFKNEQQYGPYPVEQLREFVQQGHFTLEDYACGDGQNWIPLSQIPGFAAQAQVGQPQQAAQPAQAQVPQVGTQVPQAKVAGATGGASKKKKIILFSSIGAGCLVAIITMLIIFLGSDDEEKGDQVADADKDKQGTPADQEDKQGGTDKGGSSGTDDKDKETEQPSGEKASSLAEVPLLGRIPSDVLAVALIDYGTMLEKGGQEILSLLPPDSPTQLTTVLKDPSTVGLDSSAPLQVIVSAYDGPDDDGLIGIAGKLGDATKFKTIVGLLPEMGKPEQKDGYELYVVPGTSLSCLGVAKDFFVIWGIDGGPGAMDDLVVEMEKFIHSDGSDSMANSNESFQAFAGQSHDAAIWVNGGSLDQLPGASEEIPEQLSDLIKAGSGVITLDFENGEAVLAGELQFPEGFERFGNGGLSESAVNLIPAKPLAALSLSLDMKAVVDYLEKVVLPAAGGPVSLDEVIPQLGIKPRDVLEAFTGEISVAITEFSMGSGGSDPNEDLPIEAEPEADPFGGGGEEQPPAEVDPFGGSPDPHNPSQETPGGGPGMGGLPVEFIAALSVDPANWEKLKAAPPLTMAMGLAMLQGISVTVKDDRLLIASKKHMAEAMEGSVKNKLSGSEQSLFKDNDFALKLEVAAAAKLENIPLPPPVMADLKAFSYVAVTGKSHEKGSSGALRIGLADTQSNSLKTLLEIGPSLMMMLGGESSPDVHVPTAAAGGQDGLHEAAEDGDLVAIENEISNGTNIDSQMGKDGETPLHRAVTRGQLEAAKFLVSKGAEVNLGRKKDGKTALDLAENRGHEELAEFLRNNGGKNSKELN
jgi:hypothetical protein